MKHADEQKMLNLKIQSLTITQRQRVGAKTARYTKMINEMPNVSNYAKNALLELVDYSYKDGFLDGLEKR